MELVTARLRLDGLCESDAETLFRYRSDPSVARYQGWCPSTCAEVLDFIRAQRDTSANVRDRWFQRAIRCASNNVLIGDLGVHVPADQDGSYEFGVTIAPTYQGMGYAREAVRAVLDDLFLTQHAHRVQASIDPRNLASAALLRSLGMRQEAHFQESLKLRGEWVDDAIFAILAREWEQPIAR